MGTKEICEDQTNCKIEKTYDEILNIFEQANAHLFSEDGALFANNVSERTLCGALAIKIHDIIRDRASYRGYHADVEYNRNKGSVKTIRKTVRGNDEQIITINCDLILHSRGENTFQDNLLAVEMKKSTRTLQDKNKDRDRLIALTKDSFNDVWAWNGKSLPEHVCRYVLGVYYEIDYDRRTILLEYYQKGRKVDQNTVPIRPFGNG